MIRLKRIFTSILISIVGVVWVVLHFMPASFAEEFSEPRNTPSPKIEQFVPSHSGIDASAVSAEKISQFIQAYLQVIDLIEQREGDLQGAETDSESFQAQQAIQAEAIQLIEAEGLTLQEYLQLLGLANVDPEFGERVAAQLQEVVE